MLARTRIIALSLILAGMASPALAQDIRSLDKTFKKVAESSIPKTVLVTSFIAETGAKAGYGTGAVISQDGYILTCAHVIDIAKRIEISFANKKKYPAKLLGRNKRQDYALLKVEATGLPFFEIGDSANLKVGQWAVALGHPGGPYADLQPAFASGRVTGLHRKLPVQFMQRYYNDAIQTDCPIYAGNSGGPLVDLEGKLLGLNGAILQINDNAYAAPIHQIIARLAELKAGKEIEGEKAGPEAFAEMQKQIKPEDMAKLQKRMFGRFGKMFGGGKGGKDNPLSKLFDPKMMEQFGKMFGGGKDGKPGKNPLGDLFGGKGGKGMDMGKLMEQFGKMFGGKGGKPGKNPLGDLFGGGKKTPARPGKARRRATRGGKGYLGLIPADDSDARELGGVLIGEIKAGSPAQKGGLEKGDLIVSVGGKKTLDVWTLRQLVSGRSVGETLEISVIRSRLLDTSWVRERLTLDITLGRRGS